MVCKTPTAPTVRMSNGSGDGVISSLMSLHAGERTQPAPMREEEPDADCYQENVDKNLTLRLKPRTGQPVRAQRFILRAQIAVRHRRLRRLTGAVLRDETPAGRVFISSFVRFERSQRWGSIAVGAIQRMARIDHVLRQRLQVEDEHDDCEQA